MAVHFAAATDRLARTTDLLDYNSPYTLMFWFRLATLPGNGVFGEQWRLDATAADYDGGAVTTTAGVTTTAMYNDGPGAFFTLTGSAVLSVSTWYHLAVVRTTSTVLSLYLNGVLDIAMTHDDVSARTAPILMMLGAEGATIMDGRCAGIKAWNTALSVAEIAQELSTLRPSRFANLYNWDPVFPGSGERGRDYSGNGRDWTETGTLTDEDPPPVEYGAPVLAVNPLWVPPPQTIETLSRRAPYYVPARIY